MVDKMEGGWTPGPWETLTPQIDGDEPGVAIVGANLGGLVGAALPWPTEIDSGDFSRVIANARLIAAAPDLYAALSDLSAATLIVDFKSEASMAALGRMIPIARAALAKARGEAALSRAKEPAQ